MPWHDGRGEWEMDWVSVWWTMSRWTQFKIIFFLSLCAWLAVTGLVFVTFEAVELVSAHLHQIKHSVGVG